MARKKVVAINGSPHVGIGNTDQMIQMLAAGLEARDVDLEQIHLAGKNIGYCIGCALCLDKGKCWQNDDYNPIIEKILAADGVILASPVYVMQVTGQMKTFLDRSLPYGHKPRDSWKPGLTLSVSAGMAETEVADYLSRCLRIFGAFPVGAFTAIAVTPGAFMGKDAVAQRADDLARDLAQAIERGQRYPATDRDLFFWQFMGRLVRESREVMNDDFEHWNKLGLYEGFESYVKQSTAPPLADAKTRRQWMSAVIAEHKRATVKGG